VFGAFPDEGAEPRALHPRLAGYDTPCGAQPVRREGEILVFVATVIASALPALVAAASGMADAMA